jgi:hypothetical protein
MGFFSFLGGGDASSRAKAEADAIRRRAMQADEAMQIQSQAALDSIAAQKEQMALAKRAESQARAEGQQPEVDISLNIDDANDPLAAQKRRKEFFTAGSGPMSI